MGVLTDLYNAQNPPPPEEPGLGAAAIGGLKSGAASIASGLAGIPASFADYTPNIASQAQALRGNIDEYQQQVARESGTDMSLGEAMSDPGALARKAVFSATSIVPQAASLLGGGAALRGLGALAGATRAAPALGTIGRVGAIAAPTYGSIFNNLQDAAPDAPTAQLRGLAAATAVPSTALEYLPLEFLLRGGGAKAGAGLLRRIVGGGVTGSTTQGLTEGVQATIEQAARTQVDPTASLSLNDPRFASNLAESIFGGVTGGGLIGSAGGAFRRAPDAVEETPLQPTAAQAGPQVAAPGAPIQPQAPQAPFTGPPTQLDAALARRPAPLPDSAFLPPEFVGPPVRAPGLPAPAMLGLPAQALGLPSPDAVTPMPGARPDFLGPARNLAGFQQESITVQRPDFLGPGRDLAGFAPDVVPVQTPGFIGPARNLLQQGPALSAPAPVARPDFLGPARDLAGFGPEAITGQRPDFLGPARNLLQQGPETAAPIPVSAPDFLGPARNLVSPRQDLEGPVVQPEAQSEAIAQDYATAIRPNLDQEPLDTLRSMPTDTSAVIQSRAAGYQTMLSGEAGAINEDLRPAYQRYIELAPQELAFRAANPDVEAAAAAARSAKLVELDERQTRTFGNGQGETQIREARIDELLNNPETMQRFLDETAGDISDPALQEARGPQYSAAVAYAPLKQSADRALSAKGVIERMIGPERVSVQRTGDTSYYDKAKSVINIALGDVDPLSTAAHEGFHAAADAVLTRSENSIVARAFAKTGPMRQQLEAAARKLWANPDTVIEHFDTPGEAEAYAYQAWVNGELQPNGVVSSAFRKIQRFFERARNALRGEGYKDWESVFSALQAGKYAERELMGESWKASDMPKRMYSKAQPLPVDSKLREAQDIMEKMHELIPERSLKSALTMPDRADVRSTIKRAWGTVSSMHNVARQSAQAGKIMALIEAQFRYRDTLVSDADTTLQSWIDSRDTKAMERAGAKLIEFTRDRMGVVSDKDVIGSKALSEMSLSNPDDVAALSAYGRFTAEQLRAAGLKETDIKLYNDGRDAMNNAIISRALATDPTNPAFRARELDAMKSIAEGYMPLLRHGKFAVSIKGDNGKNLGFFTFQTQQEARHAERIISEAMQGIDEVSIKLSTISKGALNVSGASASDMLDLIDTFDVTLTDAQRENIIKTITAADATARKALLRRENIPGFSRDALRTMAVFVQSNANSAAKARYASEIGALVRDKKAFRREGINGGYHQDKMIELVSYLQTPHGMDDAASGAFAKLRSAAAIVHLGGSISGGLLNVSQLATATAPYLTQFGSPTKAYGGIVNALRDVGGQRFADVAHIDAEIAKLSRRSNQPGVATRIDELSTLRQATAEGVLNPSRTLAIMGVSQGKAMARSQSMRKFMDLWMAPQAITEGINRRATFLAAYRLGKELQDKQPNLFGEGARFRDAYAFANTAVIDTQGMFNKYNRPAWAREGIGSMIYTFKAYPTLMVELAANMNTQGRLMMLGTLMLASGLTGLPFSEDLMAAAQGIAKLLGIDWTPLRVPEAALRQVLQPIQKAFPEVDTTELLMNGVLDSTGISVSSRMGLGSIVPGLKGFAAGDFGQAAWDVLGPAGQPPLALGAAAGRLAQGDVLGALRSQPVKGIADIAAAVEQSMTGSQTDKYGNNIAPASVGTIMARAIGFGSTEQSRQYEMANLIQDYQAWNSDMTASYRADMADAIRSGDTEAQQNVIDAIIAWNESHPNPRDRINLNTKELLRQVGTPTLLARRIRGPSATLRANDLLTSMGADPDELR